MTSSPTHPKTHQPGTQNHPLQPTGDSTHWALVRSRRNLRRSSRRSPRSQSCAFGGSNKDAMLGSRVEAIPIRFLSLRTGAPGLTNGGERGWPRYVTRPAPDEWTSEGAEAPIDLRYGGSELRTSRRRASRLPSRASSSKRTWCVGTFNAGIHRGKETPRLQQLCRRPAVGEVDARWSRSWLDPQQRPLTHCSSWLARSPFGRRKGPLHGPSCSFAS